MSESVEGAITKLGELVSEQLASSLQALSQANLALADEVVRRDEKVNQVRYAIEAQVEAEVLTGPESNRLRFLISALSVINDLERMGDHAEGIAKVALMIGEAPARSLPAGLVRMGELVQPMLDSGLVAFLKRDIELARQLSEQDDQVDELYDLVYSELFAGMSSDGTFVVPGTYLLWVAHNLERIADRVTNLCERTIYLETGQLEELNVSNY